MSGDTPSIFLCVSWDVLGNFTLAFFFLESTTACDSCEVGTVSVDKDALRPYRI